VVHNQFLSEKVFKVLSTGKESHRSSGKHENYLKILGCFSLLSPSKNLLKGDLKGFCSNPYHEASSSLGVIVRDN